MLPRSVAVHEAHTRQCATMGVQTRQAYRRMWRMRQQWRDVICYAHRGARGHAPENTLMAFDLAFDLGAEAIECDVQRSKDGELVIIHDGTVNRTTNGVGAVAALPFADLRALDAGRVWRIPQ